MQEAVILTGNNLKQFCTDLNINPNTSKIIIIINNEKAEYYNFEDDCLYNLDINIALKYLKINN